MPLWFRERLSATTFGLSWSGEEAASTDQRQTEVYRTIAQQTRVLLLAATLVPLLILTAYPALRAINYLPVHGPAGGIFYALNETLSYSVPLVLVALVLIGYSLRERLVTYAFSAGLFLNVTVTMAYLLSVVAVHGNMDRVVVVQVVQLNAITSSLYAILWLSARTRWQDLLSQRGAALAEKLFSVQSAIAIISIALVLIPVAVHLVIRPGWAGSGTAAAGATLWLAGICADHRYVHLALPRRTQSDSAPAPCAPCWSLAVVCSRSMRVGVRRTGAAITL